jgi:hypothetical protein
VVEKKKAAPKAKKEKSPAPVVTEEVVAVVEKKKAAPKAKKEKSPAPVKEKTPEPVVEKKKEKKVVAKKKAPEPVKEKTPEPVEELAAEELTEEEEEEDCDGPSAKVWNHEGTEYYKSCDQDCDVADCDCTGVVYDMDTQDPVGTWNGKAILPTADDE